MKTTRAALCALLIAGLLAALTGCQCSVSTAKVTDAFMTTAVDEAGMPGDRLTSTVSTCADAVAYVNPAGAPAVRLHRCGRCGH